MLESRIWILLSKKLSGEASPGEITELTMLLNDHPRISYQLDILLSFWDSKTIVERNETAFEKLSEKIKQLQHKEPTMTEG